VYCKRSSKHNSHLTYFFIIIFLYLLNDVCHIVSLQQTLPAFFQLVLFLAAAAASSEDLSPADAIFLVMNPGLGCGSRLRPPSWRIVCWWVSVTIVVFLRYWMVSPVNNLVIPRRTRCVISQGKIPWNTPLWLGIEKIKLCSLLFLNFTWVFRFFRHGN